MIVTGLNPVRYHGVHTLFMDNFNTYCSSMQGGLPGIIDTFNCDRPFHQHFVPAWTHGCIRYERREDIWGCMMLRKETLNKLL